jgi:hypothetical protein
MKSSPMVASSLLPKYASKARQPPAVARQLGYPRAATNKPAHPTASTGPPQHTRRSRKHTESVATMGRDPRPGVPPKVPSIGRGWGGGGGGVGQPRSRGRAAGSGDGIPAGGHVRWGWARHRARRGHNGHYVVLLTRGNGAEPRHDKLQVGEHCRRPQRPVEHPHAGADNVRPEGAGRVRASARGVGVARHLRHSPHGAPTHHTDHATVGTPRSDKRGATARAHALGSPRTLASGGTWRRPGGTANTHQQTHAHLCGGDVVGARGGNADDGPLSGIKGGIERRGKAHDNDRSLRGAQRSRVYAPCVGQQGTRGTSVPVAVRVTGDAPTGVEAWVHAHTYTTAGNAHGRR